MCRGPRARFGLAASVTALSKCPAGTLTRLPCLLPSTLDLWRSLIDSTRALCREGKQKNSIHRPRGAQTSKHTNPARPGGQSRGGFWCPRCPPAAHPWAKPPCTGAQHVAGSGPFAPGGCSRAIRAQHRCCADPPGAGSPPPPLRRSARCRLRSPGAQSDASTRSCHVHVGRWAP